MKAGENNNHPQTTNVWVTHVEGDWEIASFTHSAAEQPALQHTYAVSKGNSQRPVGAAALNFLQVLVPFTALAKLPLLPAALTRLLLQQLPNLSVPKEIPRVLVYPHQPWFAPQHLVYIQNVQHSLLNITPCRCVHFHRINSVLVTFVVPVLYTLQIKNMFLMVTAKHKNWTLQRLLLGPFRGPLWWIS